MDVDKLIKINNLSKELQRHGIATSTIEAVQQARVVIEESPGQEEVVLVEQPRQEVSTEVPKPLSPLQERRFELILEANNRHYDKEIAALKAAVASLSTQVEQMRLELKSLNEKQLQANVKKEKQEVLKTETKENHPRQGAFKPGDDTVAIDKIFYFGTGGAKF